MARDTVLLVLGQDPRRNFLDSVLALLARDLTADDGRLSLSLSVHSSSHALEDGCDRAVGLFLETGEPWCLWCDLDQGWAPDALDRLHGHADAVQRPLVAALTYIWDTAEQDGLHGWLCRPRPSILVEHDDGFAVHDDFPRDRPLIPVAATGMGLTLVHRSVFERIADGQDRPTWFRRLPGPDGATLMGSDVSFYARARRAAVQPYVALDVPTNHAKDSWIGPQVHDGWLRANGPEVPSVGPGPGVR